MGNSMGLARRVAVTALAALLLLAPAAAGWSQDGQGEGQGHNRHSPASHVHGVAELNLVLEGKILEIELISPAANIVGFEHAPRTPEQRQALSYALDRLEKGAMLFRFPAAAVCRLKKAEVSSGIDAVGDGPDDHDHADFFAHWTYRCNQPDLLDEIEVRIFNHFRRTERIRVQAVTPRGQSAVELTPADRHLKL